MRHSITLLLVLALVASIAIAPGLYAQAKKDPKTGLDRIDGVVTSIDKDKSTIMVRQRGAANVVWTVGYTADTKFTFRNKEGSLDDVKDGRRLIILGKAEEGSKMTATRIDVRTER